MLVLHLLALLEFSAFFVQNKQYNYDLKVYLMTKQDLNDPAISRTLVTVDPIHLSILVCPNFSTSRKRFNEVWEGNDGGVGSGVG